VNTFDPSAKISPLADIEESVRGSLLRIGPLSSIDAFVKIKFTGGGGNIMIGADSHINSGCVLYSGNGITIGDYVMVAANCTFAPVNHQYDRTDVPMRVQGFRPSKGGIIVEDDVWIAAGCVILDGAHIRQGCIIAANAVVSGATEPYGIYAGSPAKLVARRER
jgi:virginiamycin A acetyltransferase